MTHFHGEFVGDQTDCPNCELAALRTSYEHLVSLRDEVIEMGILPPTDQWSSVNPNL